MLFFTNGAIFANLLPRYPEIKAHLDLTNGAFGFAVSAFALGALLAGLTAGSFVRRFGSARVAILATVLSAAGIVLAGVAPVGAILAAGLFLAGAMDSITDVAQNSHGLRVQRLYNRSILNSFHAVWSVGAVLGGILGAVAAQFAVPVVTHLTVSAVFFSLMAAFAYRFLLPGAEPITAGSPATVTGGTGTTNLMRPPRLLSRYGILVALVVIAASGAIVEDAGSSWAAIYLSGSLGASAFIAGAGFIALQGMQFVGRIVGDRLVDRFGQRLVARTGGTIAFVGMGLALAFPTVLGTVIGFGLAGLGVATLIPAAMHAANELPGFRPGTGLTIVSWLLRVGFLLSPPIIGAIADASTVRFGLLIVPAAGVLVFAFAFALSSKPSPSTQYESIHNEAPSHMFSTCAECEAAADAYFLSDTPEWMAIEHRATFTTRLPDSKDPRNE
ncbi:MULTISPECIES: MFS transporter [unclassified Cryobacterium]|uniref:MFS transporter n=1 Tax=unclassified Cryobacterium TaxID=2649013 RepID=UPI002AB56FD2|nr:MULTISPECIES: MFS transporter [unclassified Cryobacterium]MDY7543994.1 MFS transporter [Cryobacterium sp. 5B3]MEA9997725.1 MFS transporter [Cryobacterium sp. RTS3]MEB0265829.1 MFS transporter [Cryobacterium sp. 10I5]MEB0273181.1 MFS transporter [Cryobacterium sp. 5B3]